MGYTFISYSRKDVGFVQILVSSLRMRGIETWFDIARLKPGMVWDNEIHAALKAADWVLVVASPESMASREVEDEWKFARYLGKSIIPVLYHDCELHYRLNALNYVDFRRGEYEPPLNALVETLRQPPVLEAVGRDAEELAADARSDNWLVRREAVQRLLDIGAGAVGGAGLTALIAALSDQRQSVADAALKGLSDSPLAEVKEALRRIGRAPDLKIPPRKIRRVGQAIAPEWVEIPAGYFIYGDDEISKEWKGTAHPRQRRWLDTFYIARYPVTNQEFQVFVEASGYRFFEEDREWSDKRRRNLRDRAENKPDHPVTNVEWDDAVAYCKWLSRQLGYEVVLPSEEQWEKAARGPNGRVYPWGDTFDSMRCNTSESGIHDTTPVDRYPSGCSPYSVFDLAGNVWEWTATEWEPSRIIMFGKPVTTYVQRGGSCDYGCEIARCVYRYGLSIFMPDGGNRGFRVCASAPT